MVVSFTKRVEHPCLGDVLVDGWTAAVAGSEVHCQVASETPVNRLVQTTVILSFGLG